MSHSPLKRLLTAATASLALALTACGSAQQSSSSADGASAAPTTAASATPSPQRTPGKGPACEGVRCVSVMMTGDVLLHQGLWQQAQEDAKATGQGTMDFYPMIEGQKAYADQADLSICHLETPLGPEEGPFSAYPMFSVPPQVLTALKKVGYQACDTASNHTFDKGTEGVERTIDFLDAAGIAHTGSYKTEEASKGITLIQTPAAKIALITGAYGWNGMVPEFEWQGDLLDADKMLAKAATARQLGADIVIASMHAGDEYQNYANEQQIETAHKLLASDDIDFVYGHHTHSVLPIEKVGNKWVVYGLGNAETEHDPNNQVAMEGLLARVQFSQGADGKWTTSDLAWAPSTIGVNWFPYRWCSLAADKPQGTCISPEKDEEMRQRTISTVNSMGADQAGAHELLLGK